VRADEDRQAGGVHEIQSAQVDDDQPGIGPGELVELGFELRARCKIELPAHRHHRGRSIPADFDTELILHAGARAY